MDVLERLWYCSVYIATVIFGFMNIWKRKLMAFLHDPPCKPLDIGGHENAALDFLKRAGLTEADKKEFLKECDWDAAAADRFPFPVSDKLKSGFDGSKDSPFRHPLGGDDLVFDAPIPSAAFAEEIFQEIQNGLDLGRVPDEIRDWANFFLHWRRWPVEAAKKDWRTAFLPADTRIPDHSIWVHNSIVSALQACVDGVGSLKPAFMLFHLGPVQEFIAQARSIRDLWSGSYLLSWLMAHAMRTVADRVGPDNVIFPSLRGVPLVDALYKESLFDLVDFADGKGGKDSLWKRMNLEPEKIFTPNLPNRFLALIPVEGMEVLAKDVGASVMAELKRIATACWDWFGQSGIPMDADWRTRYDKQVELFPQTAWQVLPWEGSVSSCLQAYEKMYAGVPDGAKNLSDLNKLATSDMPKEDRDKRYFAGGNVSNGLSNIGFCWSYFYAECDRLLAARRNTRDFAQWKTDEHQTGARKDSFSGKEEVIGSEDWWVRLRESEKTKYLFRSKDCLGAMNIIKKVWHVAYLANKSGFENAKKVVKFESVPEIAAAKPLTDAEQEKYSGYIAILALDGDDIGKWVSGEKAPRFLKQLSSEGRKYFEGVCGKELNRTLSPSWHLQFSEALSNFALHIARQVVEAYDGQLIYAGGDDVLAMLPAGMAFVCAEQLRKAFRGDRDLSVRGFAVRERGFVRQQKEKYVLMVPGPVADVSIGVAIGHCHAPLQSLIEAGRQAEKRAKKIQGKASMAVSLLKRSGEIVEWSTKLEGGLLGFLEEFIRLSDGVDAHLSGRFAYAFNELVDPYLGRNTEDVGGFDWGRVVSLELTRVFSRQSREKNKEVQEFQQRIKIWIEKNCRSRQDAVDLAMMFRVGAFLLRKESSRHE